MPTIGDIGGALGAGAKAVELLRAQRQAAEIAAQQFEALGTPTALRMAAMLRADPVAAINAVSAVGGLDAIFRAELERLQREQDLQERERQRQVREVEADLLAEALFPEGDEERGRALMAERLRTIGRLGGDPKAAIQAFQAAREVGRSILARGSAGLDVLQKMGLDPDNFSPESVQMFLDHLNLTGEVDLTLLEPKSEGRVPTGYRVETIEEQDEEGRTVKRRVLRPMPGNLRAIMAEQLARLVLIYLEELRTGRKQLTPEERDIARFWLSNRNLLPTFVLPGPEGGSILGGGGEEETSPAPVIPGVTR